MVSLKEIQKFIQELAKSDLVRLELKTEDLELNIQFKQEVKDSGNNSEKIILPQITNPITSVPNVPSVQQMPQVSEPVQQQVNNKKADENSEKQDDDLVEIKSPMVGTFYRRPKPDKPPYVEVGDHVKPGQVVCIIEAMKLFNEIESEVDGVIEKILVEDKTPVEYGQPLFLLRISK